MRYACQTSRRFASSFRQLRPAGQGKNFRVMATRKTRSNATQTQNTNAASKQQVKNRKNGKNVPAPTSTLVGTPVPAKLEELQSRYDEYTKDLSEAKKQSKRVSEKLAKASDLVQNERYCIAVSRVNMGTATAEDLAIISSRKAEQNASEGLAKLFAKDFKDADDVAKARELAKGEEGSLHSAIAETLRNWTKCYCTLYKTIGITSKKSLTADLVKDLCPYLMIATADGLKAATANRTAVRKNGKAVKVKGKRVYKYTLREKSRWTAYGLFETLERNFRLADLFTEDELNVRRQLLAEQVFALVALKAAKEAEKSDVPEQADDAAKAADKLKAAAKAAAQAAKQNAAEKTQHTTKGGELKKVG